MPDEVGAVTLLSSGLLLLALLLVLPIVPVLSLPSLSEFSGFNSRVVFDRSKIGIN